MLYFGAGTLDSPGAMFTASHNPARYNGIKLCRAGAVPIGQDTGLVDDPGGRRGRGAGRARAAAPSASATCSATTPATCAGWST